MWGREMRAGLLFVLVSVTAGGAFRGWQRSHHERFDTIVAWLVEAEGRDTSASARATRAAPASDSAAARAPALKPGALARARPAAAALRPASMDVDRASEAELLRLPGIGPSLAARIVAERSAGGPFGGPDGLLRVRGIGPKTLEKIRPYLSP
jgi:competence ComEA-like helix-hairpin-helix protein